MKLTKQHIANQIVSYLEGNKERMLCLLKELVAIESPSRNKVVQNEIFNLIEKELQATGYITIRVKGNKTGGYLFARPKKREKRKVFQLIIGHCDTVWEVNMIKEIPINLQNGKMTGPGIYDMKSGITQILYALKVIKDLSLKAVVMPIILINSDEEIGSKESTHIITRLSKIACRSFVLEPPLGAEGKLKTARKGVGKFTIEVFGKAAHAGLDPEKGVNAIVELSNLVQQLYEMNDFGRGITINIGMIEGGYLSNVVAPKSKAVIDVRVYNAADGDEISKKIHQLKPMNKDAILTIEGGINRFPMQKNHRNQKLWKIAKKNGQLIGLGLNQTTAGGGSDGNITSQYTATLDGLGTVGDGAHARHEFIYTNTLVKRTALLSLLLLEDP